MNLTELRLLRELTALLEEAGALLREAGVRVDADWDERAVSALQSARRLRELPEAGDRVNYAAHGVGTVLRGQSGEDPELVSVRFDCGVTQDVRRERLIREPR